MKNNVPLLDLNAQFESIEEEVRSAVDEVFDSQHFILGEQVEEFEKQAAKYCGARYGIGCASGSDALLLSLMAIDLQPGDFVITTSYSFFATGGAIARLGGIPLFVDIDPVTCNLDVEQVEALLEGEHPFSSRMQDSRNRIRAVIPVHLYGQMADMDPLMGLAEQYGLTVIEDAAQSIGAQYRGRKAGSIGDFGCFSFFPSKNLGAFGDAGLIVTDDSDYAEKLRILRVHGSKPKYHHKIVGINSRLDTLQAAVLLVKLKYLDDWSDARREKALHYNDLFARSELVESGLVTLPAELEGLPGNGGRHIYHQYVIRTPEREKVMKALDRANVGHAVYYPVPLHQQECFADLGYRPEDCPEAVRASRETLALPIYPELTAEQQEYVVEAVQDAL